MLPLIPVAPIRRFDVFKAFFGLFPGSISINVRITAVRKLAVEAADNGLLAPELAGIALSAAWLPARRAAMVATRRWCDNIEEDIDDENTKRR
jgi:hypothetical protein